jgi:hypothetical protein
MSDSFQKMCDGAAVQLHNVMKHVPVYDIMVVHFIIVWLTKDMLLEDTTYEQLQTFRAVLAVLTKANVQQNMVNMLQKFNIFDVSGLNCNLPDTAKIFTRLGLCTERLCTNSVYAYFCSCIKELEVSKEQLKVKLWFYCAIPRFVKIVSSLYANMLDASQKEFFDGMVNAVVFASCMISDPRKWKLWNIGKIKKDDLTAVAEIAVEYVRKDLKDVLIALTPSKCEQFLTKAVMPDFGDIHSVDSISGLMRELCLSREQALRLYGEMICVLVCEHNAELLAQP